jgi:D-alanyl-D-alanine carboxypeptidase/D-alanyl-D-alanine carboxypeptidase (penicillin-binding protein 5/6)
MKRLLTLAIILSFLIFNAGVSYAQPPSPDAGAYILIDAKTGDVLSEKNSDITMFPASTTKIMTAIIALESGTDLDTELTATQSAIDRIGVNGSNIGIIPGEKISLENLLKATLISSANEAANIIAENICDSYEDFIALMNKRARELGATGTHFVNASGIHDPEHYSTAVDLARIARHAMTLPKFREIVSTHSFTMPATNKHSKWPVLSNSNKLMVNDKNDLYVIDGIKTGFTGPAGYNLITSATGADGMELISVIMKVENENAPENVRVYSKEMLDYGFNNFKEVTLIEEGRVYRNVKVEEAADIYGLDLITTESLVRVLPKDESQWDIQETSHVNENIFAPVNKGDVMGYVEFKKGGRTIGRIDLLAARSIEYKPAPVTLATLTTDTKKVYENIYIRIGIFCAGFIVIFIILRIILKAISRRSNSRRHSRKYF